MKHAPVLRSPVRGGSRERSARVPSVTRALSAPAAPRPSAARPATAPCACGGACPRCTGLTATSRLASAQDPRERAAQSAASRVAAGRRPTAVSDYKIQKGLLPRSVRVPLEAALGADLSRVRVHADARAARDAATLGAHAYATNDTIVFGAGRYAPHTREGYELLAHEAAHVVEQRRAGTPDLVQRAAVEYVERVDNKKPEAAAVLQRFDTALANVDTALKTQSGPQMTDLNAAAAQLKVLRAADKIAVWRMVTMPPVYATFHNPSGQIRLNLQYPAESTAENTLVHEAIHAVHAARNPEIAAAYGKGRESGVPAGNTSLALLFYRWKAWTEYWAYRRGSEFSGPQQLAADPDAGHKSAIDNDEVKKAVRIVHANGDPAFDPSKWQPTAADKAAAKAFIGP